MIGAVWNIRGLNKTGRFKCPADFIRLNNLDFVGIQETKKEKFCDRDFHAIDSNMIWNYAHAVGTVGGILVGFRS
jgi:hypothetical protein